MRIIGCDPSLTNCGVSDGENHTIIQTSAVDSETQEQNLTRRCTEIVHGIYRFFGERCDAILLYIEGPQLGLMANHIYEIGFLMSRIHYFFDDCEIHVVPSGVWRKALFGKGNIAKDAIALAAFKKFGIEIPNDRGLNKLEAYCLAKYGAMVESGEIEHIPSRLRGTKKRKKAV